MIWPLSTLLGLIIVLVISAATAYFVAQEFAYMSVDRSRLKAAAAAGDAGAGRALAVTRRTSFMLSGAQLGITVTGLLVGYVAEPLIGEAIGEALGGVAVPTAVGITVGTVLALLFSTFVQMLLGELFPKNLAIARPEPIAIALSRSTAIYLKLFGWLITVFDHASNLLLKALRIEPVHDVEHSATQRDLEHIVAESRESGDLRPEMSALISRILEFPERTVDHAMVPRARAGVLRPDATLGEVRELMRHGHSRYPVLDDDEAVLGVVHLSDVLTAPTGGHGNDSPAVGVMRPPLLVPTSMRLPDALDALVSSRSQLACVLDEYGGFAGVLAAEDLAEELVGEIDDEHDPETVVTPDRASGGEPTWTLPADLPLDELARLIGRVLPTGDHETVSGLAIAGHGTFPAVGDRIRVALPPDPAAYAVDDEPPPELLELEILAIDRTVPSLVRVTLEPTGPGSGRADVTRTTPTGAQR
ncbi:hemolysin family protein [Nakamurella deserti]|uniref:hemolysin family protein n=1 Tax=Nakamurella deserti TaxID=2164074 RepID=UPI00197B630E|nr:hemolysin family protein [Nakamurella deserti]